MHHYHPLYLQFQPSIIPNCGEHRRRSHEVVGKGEEDFEPIRGILQEKMGVFGPISHKKVGEGFVTGERSQRYSYAHTWPDHSLQQPPSQAIVHSSATIGPRHPTLGPPLGFQALPPLQSLAIIPYHLPPQPLDDTWMVEIKFSFL